MPLGNRFEDALVYATRTHASQERKGDTGIPYVAHLLGVAALVLEDGGDEDEAIAGLLHDAIEDCGIRAEELVERYGERVAEIVVGCSDADIQPKPAWRPRKERYIARLAEAHPSIVRVSLADKVHNARSVLFDYRELGEELWGRFNPEADQLWYYRSLVAAFRVVSESRLVDELERVVSELDQVAASGALRRLASEGGEAWVELRAGEESVRLGPAEVREAETDEEFRELVRAARVRLYERPGVAAGAPIGITASWRQTASL